MHMHFHLCIHSHQALSYFLLSLVLGTTILIFSKLPFGSKLVADQSAAKLLKLFRKVAQKIVDKSRIMLCHR